MKIRTDTILVHIMALVNVIGGQRECRDEYL